MRLAALLTLLLAGCGGGDQADAECTRDTQDRSTREQALWVERCPTGRP